MRVIGEEEGSASWSTDSEASSHGMHCITSVMLCAASNAEHDSGGSPRHESPSLVQNAIMSS